MVADYAKELIGVATTVVSLAGGAAWKWKEKTDTRIAALEQKFTIVETTLSGMREMQTETRDDVKMLVAHLLEQ